MGAQFRGENALEGAKRATALEGASEDALEVASEDALEVAASKKTHTTIMLPMIISGAHTPVRRWPFNKR
jgi:hypothetical protein